MCGICGKVARQGSLGPNDTDLVRRMVSTLRHRGPDGQGQENFRGAILGHVRLSIIDLATGAQPMSNEDRSVCVVFNGEIYNFQELRERLEALGHRFASHSDTEVIIHAYEQFGEECVEQFRGMFAFALWDENAQSLLLARDRLGKKPLHYAETQDGLVFASEIRPVLCDALVSSELDECSVAQYLRCGFITAPLSIYRQIHKLPPAHYATYKDGTLRVKPYWSLDFSQCQPRRLEEALEGLEEVFREAVRLRMISDVPLGAFLSGGIDSTLVVGMMQKLASSPISTFCIAFPDEELDERRYAAEVANVLGTRHHTFEMGDPSPQLLHRVAWHYGEPFSDATALPTFVLSELARKQVTVALNGDGGDEAFGGYDRYYYLRDITCSRGCPLDASLNGPDASRTAGWPRLTRAHSAASDLLCRGFSKAKKQLKAILLSHVSLSDRYWALHDVFGSNALREILTPAWSHLDKVIWVPPSVDAALRSDTESLGALQLADIVGCLPDQLLFKVDAAAMAHGLECRSPFLDHKVVEFAASLPANLRAHPEYSKYLLREAARTMAPRHIVWRRKQGFIPPIARWLDGSLNELVSTFLLGGSTSPSGLFQRDGIIRWLAGGGKHRRGSEGLWRLLMFELWYQQRTQAPRQDDLQCDPGA